MLRTIGTAVSLFTLSAMSSPLLTKLLLRDQIDNAPGGFTLSGVAPADTVLNLHIGLVQSNPVGLAEKLYDVSTPSSGNYRKYLSKEEAAAYVAPTAESLAAVTSWLEENNIVATPSTPAGDWLSIQVPVSLANAMLGADFSVFTHEESGQQSIRTLSYSIPAGLDDHLDFVYPTTSFAPPPPTMSTSNVNGRAQDAGYTCGQVNTPACLQALYGIPATPATSPTNQLLVTGYLNEYALQSDLELFLETFRPDLSPNTSFALQTLDGGSNPQNGHAGVDASLDMQYAVGIASGVPVTFLSVGQYMGDGLSQFADTANFLLSVDVPPQTMTTGYGIDEPLVDPRVAKNLCNAYAQLGLRGVSVLFSSGDGGVAGSRFSNTCTNFVPTFPSTCPFITSVGATTGISPESGASFSAGGFSTLFERPQYQDDAVPTYLSFLGSTYAGLYNASGRGFPDVAAQGVRFEVVVGGVQSGASGTRAAGPVFAGAVALLNDALAGAGGAPLGFLNPLLYTAQGALGAVASGRNPGCGTEGFPAEAGWDPVTGLGTPIYSQLLAAIGL